MLKRTGSMIAILFLTLAATTIAQQPATQDKHNHPRLVMQLGHTDVIRCVAFSPNGRWVLTGSTDHTAILWDAATGRKLIDFVGHSGEVSSVAFSPDGRWILTGSGPPDKTVRLWETATGKEVRRFEVMLEASSVAFSRNSRKVLAGDSYGVAFVWDAGTANQVHRFEEALDGVRRATVSPCGRWVLTTQTKNGQTNSRLWEAATGKELRRFEMPDFADSVVFSPDGRWILTRMMKDKTARLWDTATGRPIQRFEGHTKSVEAVAFSPHGQWVMTGSQDKTARLWETATGKEIRRFEGTSGMVSSIAFSPDGRSVLTGSCGWDEVSVRTVGEKRARLWATSTGKEIRRFEGDAGSINFAAYSPDGRWIALSGHFWRSKSVHLWDASMGKELRRFEHSGPVYDVTFTADPQYIAIGGSKTTQLLDIATSKQVSNFDGLLSGSSRNGRWLLTRGADKTIRLWDVKTGKEMRRFAAPDIGKSAISLDGRWVATGSSQHAVLWDAATGKEVRRFEAPEGIYSGVNSLAFSPDGRLLVIGSQIFGTALLWDRATGQLALSDFKGHTSSWQAQGRSDKAVYSVAFSPDGKQFLTGSEDMTARLWDTATGKEVRRFTGHTDPVRTVAFSPDGRRVLTATNKMATLWDVDTGKELCSLVSFDDGAWAVVDPAGRYDASSGGAVNGLHWVVKNEPIDLAQLKERYYDPGLLAKVLGFNKEPLRRVEAFTDPKMFPDVFIAEPKGSTLALDLANRGGGIGKVQVLVNGKELLADARGPKPDPNDSSTTLTVDLANAPSLKPGEANVIEVVTWNAEGYLSSRGIQRLYTPEGQKGNDPPKVYAIVVGVSEYANEALNLRYSAKDAEDMAKTLELGAKRLFGADNIELTLLTTSKDPNTLPPSKLNIQKAFEKARQAKPGDILIVYLAGHGVTLQSGSDTYCFLTKDARTSDIAVLADPALLRTYSVTSTELTEWIKKIPALKQVMILDTCAAGAAAVKLTDHRNVNGDQIRAIERLKDRTGFHVLMGCASDKVSYEATRFEQGLLTHALLKGMCGAALDREEFVDIGKLFQYAADEVPLLAQNVGGIQKPLIAAPRGTSFDIGQLTTPDKAAIPLAFPRPFVLRPLLLNPDEGDDNLQLMPKLRRALANASALSSRGKRGALFAVYVDAEEMPGALRPTGTYKITGDKVEVRLLLRRDGKTVATMNVPGDRNQLDALVQSMVETLVKEFPN